MPSKNIGKTIINIKKCQKHVTITFSDHTNIKLSHEVYTTSYLYINKELTNKEINELKHYNDTASYMKYALNLLKKSFYSEWKMREKLYAKGADKKDVDLIIKRLKEHDFINDKMLMMDWVNYGNERNIGKNKIKKELIDKGIFVESIEKLSFPLSLEKKKAKNNLTKLEKKYDKCSYQGKRQKIYRALLSLGFEMDVALETIDYIKENNHIDELERLSKDMDKIYRRLSNKYEDKQLIDKIFMQLKNKGYRYKDVLTVWSDKYGENDC